MQPTAAVSIVIAGDDLAAAWDAYVFAHPQATHCHLWGWKSVLENGFRWQTFYLAAMNGSQIVGVLPLLWQNKRLFGNSLTSLASLNAGGPLADSHAIEQQLVDRAIEIAMEIGASSLELRYRGACSLSLQQKTGKVDVVRPVIADTEQMFRDLHKKVRTDIKKAMKSGLSAAIEGPEALDDFYRIFAANMRDLGTPVYSRAWFAEILRAFPQNAHLCVVRHEGRAIASTLLIGFRDTIEAICSSSLRAYLPLKPNMMLYWKNICFAGESGYQVFDFGRSSRDSGTHQFKMQWGGQAIPLYWAYWLRDGGELPNLSPSNRKYRAAIWCWQRLPVPLTRLIGPPIARCLP